MAHTPYTRIIPESSTAIIMIHGIIGTPDHFRDMIPLVPEEWSVYNLLLPGHGKTARDFAHSSMSDWKSHVAELVEKLSAEGKRILIAAHSMGTLFAIQAALKHPDTVRGLFLMGSCLQVGLRSLVLSNALKVSLGLVRPTDEAVVAASRACSIMPTKRLWQYLGWLPRYWELFREIRYTRQKVPQLSVPCRVYQSSLDEMVSVRAARWFEESPIVQCTFLEHSTHFHYQNGDYDFLLEQFRQFCNTAKTETPG